MKLSPINFVHLCEIFLVNNTLEEIWIDLEFKEDVKDLIVKMEECLMHNFSLLKIHSNKSAFTFENKECYPIVKILEANKWLKNKFQDPS